MLLLVACYNRQHHAADVACSSLFYTEATSYLDNLYSLCFFGVFLWIDMADQATLAAAYLVLSHAARQVRQRKKKRWWKRTLFRKGPRASLIRKLNAEDGGLFKDFTRMSNVDFEHLLQLVTPYIQREDTNYQDSISPRMRLLITLRFLATGDSYKSLMYLFKVSFSTISLIVPEVCKAISTVLEEYIKVPKDEGEWKTVARNFEIKWNFPHCIGAIDGKHVQIICPANTGTEYFNYKKTFSIVLMAIVDANYCFQYVHVGCQGRISDGGVYKSTSFYKELKENRLKIPQAEPLLGREKSTPYVLVADDAFALTINCMKPYAGQQSQSPERIFNYRLSRARRIVENAFGIMASVFRVFGKPMQLKVENVETITKSCTYLHNYLRKSRTSRPLYTPQGSFDTEDLENGVIINGTWRQITCNDTGLTDLQRVPRPPPIDAKLVREELKEYFMTPQGKVEWQDMYQ